MLSILGLVAVFIATYYVYKTAKDTGRNAVGWALLTFAVGFGIQIILPIIIGIIIAIVMSASGNSIAEIQKSVENIAMIIGIACLVFSVVGIWLIMRRVSKIPESETFTSPPPPPPPTFDGE